MRWLWGWCCCWALIAAGCGGGDGIKRLATVPTKGTVTIDGKPFGPGTVSFLPQSNDAEKRKAAVGLADANGNFTVTSYEKGDGAVPGEYAIVLTGEVGQAPPPSTEPMKVRIGEKGEENLQISMKSNTGASSLLTPKLNTSGAGTGLKPR